MFDGKSIKPQEEGPIKNFQRIPSQSGWYWANWCGFMIHSFQQLREMDPDPKGIRENSGQKSNSSDSRIDLSWKNSLQYLLCCMSWRRWFGKYHCGQKGVPAPPILPFFKMPTATSHLYNKIKYGSFYQEPRGLMPAFGDETSVNDRWDMVNYMLSNDFGEEIGQ